ncbi:hypothetical protein GQ53DRAFT_89745 [Thozetella sp. PMI_491]|nr:hypothetical protein GQ53DRAFT_89745 [Thozetella sp. PMI_491]
MVSDCRDDVIRHFNTSDLDAVADYVVSMASEAFLDKCLEKRLLTIEAKPLINALARAERLGYEQSDIIDLKSQQEQVIPYPGHQARQGPFPSSFPSPVPPPPPPPSHSAPPPAYPPSTPVQHAPVGAAHPAIPAPPQQSPELEGKDSKGREVMQCVRCYRTFVYVAAYQHHIEKNVCTRLPPSAGGYRWACDLCGAPFATAGGLHYHAANKVCLNAPSVSPPAGPPASLPGVASIFPTNSNPPSTPDFRGSVHKIVAAIKPSPAHESSPAPSPIPGDPYAHLTPEAMTSMNQELREAEQKFAGRFQEAERIPDPDERRVKLDGLKNSFGTKQSMIRKKYGVRLRERRTKAEIAAEKARMGIGQNESAPPKPPTTTPATTGATTTPSRSGWTAANITPPTQPSTLQENGAKRRRLDETGASAASTHGTPQIEELPRKVPSMSAISTSSAAAAPVAAPLRDPPLPPPRPPQSSAHAGENIEHPRPELSPPVSLKDASAAPSRPSVKEEDTQATDPDSDSEIEDIPATLPSHIRQTLVQSAS